MKNKFKIAILIDSQTSIGICHTFVPLAKDHEVELLIYHDEEKLPLIPTNFKVHLFKKCPESFETMRGCEEILGSSDLMIIVDFKSLYLRQALRCASNNKIHVLFYWTYFNKDEFLLREQQENTISLKNLSRDTYSIAVSNEWERKEIWNCLRIEAKYLLTPLFDQKKFAFSEKGRAKFRKYINLASDNKVILFLGDLEREDECTKLLQAFSLLKYNKNIELDKLKLIVAAKGRYEKKMHYYSYQLGIGNSVYFISQDIGPFKGDLLSSCDICLLASDLVDENLTNRNILLLESIYYQLIPIVKASGAQDSILGLPELHWNGTEYEEIAILLEKILLSPTFSKQVKSKINNKLVTNEGYNQITEIIQNLQDEKKLMSEHQYKDSKIDWIHLNNMSRQEDSAQETLEIINELMDKPRSDEDISQFHRIIANSYRTMADYEKAKIHFDQALKIDPNNEIAYFEFGMLQWDLFNDESALTYFKKGLSKFPNNSGCCFGVGLIYARAKIFDNALYWLEKSISLDENNQLAIKALCNICNEIADTEEAIDILEGVVEIAGEVPFLLRTLGHLYLKIGNIELGNQLINKYFSNQI